MNSAPEEGYVRNDLAVRPRRVLRRTSHSRMGALLIEVNDVGLSKECSLLSLNQVRIILPPEILLMLQILAVQAWQQYAHAAVSSPRWPWSLQGSCQAPGLGDVASPALLLVQQAQQGQRPGALG